MPSASLVSPSSSPEQSMPWLSVPAMVVISMRRSPGSTEPGKATGMRWPTAMLVAPQTMDSSAFVSTDAHPRERQLAGVGMRAPPPAARPPRPAASRADVLDGADLHAQQGQAFGQLLGRELDIDELTQP